MKSKAPVMLSLSDQGLLIDCLVTYNRRALRALDQKKAQQPPAADLIEEGIRSLWSGTYEMTADLQEALTLFCKKRKLPLPDKESLELEVRISRIRPHPPFPAWTSFLRGLGGKRRPVRIYVRRSLFLPAHAASPLFRRFWGIFRTGQIESMGLNWSPRFPGYMTIPADTPGWRLPGVAAHEAGHIFGLGDAYGAWYRFYHAAPATSGFMMRDNSRVRSREVAMLLKAHATDRMQYFPRRFQIKTVSKNLGLSLRRPFNRLLRKRNG